MILEGLSRSFKARPPQPKQPPEHPKNEALALPSKNTELANASERKEPFECHPGFQLHAWPVGFAMTQVTRGHITCHDLDTMA